MRMVVWFDTPAASEQVVQALREGPFRQEDTRRVASALDANALLVAGEPVAFLATV